MRGVEGMEGSEGINSNRSTSLLSKHLLGFGTNSLNFGLSTPLLFGAKDREREQKFFERIQLRDATWFWLQGVFARFFLLFSEADLDLKDFFFFFFFVFFFFFGILFFFFFFYF
mmetsp:Transcript_3191/g.4518  ORF Transcript_3191/g.4518 Transcript_3191/m.4518 type:complete len:114 (+) Transcript_3191:682-1023(+)